VAHHPNREIALENLGLVRIVVQDRRDSGQQVLDTAPEQADTLGDLEMIPNGRVIRVVDVLGPIGGVCIWSPTEAWKKIELQVVVCVNQAG
jgi:hypothetical protein